MGIVWAAADSRLGRQVALKFVKPGTETPGAVDRHLREARAASALNHPGICQVHDIGEWEDHRYLVMELLEGETLEERIARGPLEPDEITSIADQVCDAVGAAHAQGIVHRDLKPSNVFLQEADDGARVKVLDFGLARASPSPVSETAETEVLAEAARTQPGTILGTLAYMSPEQALGEPVGTASDVFSLGSVLFEMATGERAFRGATLGAIVQSILQDTPNWPEDSSRLPRSLVQATEKALRKAPGERYEDARALRDGVRSGSRPEPIAATVRNVRPRRWPWAVAALTVVLLGGAYVRFFAATPEEPGDPAGSAARAVPTLAVLPFSNTSGDPDQDYFGEGLAEGIINELSRYPELNVLARSSTSRYRESDLGPKEIAAVLDADFLLDGRVRRSRDTIRLSVELSEGETGTNLWAETYERQLTPDNLFEMQDELTHHVVTATAGAYGAIVRAQLPGTRAKPPTSLRSYDCVLRAYEYLQSHTRENHLATRECLEEVVSAEQDYVESQAWLGYIYAEQYHHRWNEPGTYDSLDRALEVGEAAVDLGPASQAAHGTLALTLFFRGDYDRARVESYRTIELGPNNALWLGLIGTYLAQLDDFENGLPMVARAIELNPHPPLWINMAFFYEDYQNGDYEAALAHARTVRQGDFRTPLFEAASLGKLGRSAEAQPLPVRMQELWQRDPGELRDELIQRHAFSPSLTDHLVEGLRLAGWSPVPVDR